jgi:antitoxin component of MazEF toxin-antitoxin module
MKILETKLTQIGNSRGIRLPADLIRRHGLESGVLLEERKDHFVVRARSGGGKLSLEETARQMAAEHEDWSEWDGTAADGVEALPWGQQPPKKSGFRRQRKTRR